MDARQKFLQSFRPGFPDSHRFDWVAMIEYSFRDQFKHNFEANLVYATLARNSRPTNESVDYASSSEHRLGLGTGTANQDAICLDALPVWRTGTQASNVSSLSIRTARMARVQS